MRGIILRHDSDELIIKPSDGDIERFATGVEVSTSRYYGQVTIHQTVSLDVEVDNGPCGGEVVSVWFRCQPLPFQQTTLHKDYTYEGGRADEMRNMYRRLKATPGFSLVGVEMAT